YVRFQEKVSGKESLAMADALSDLGNVLILTDKYAETEEVLRRALTIRRKWLKPNDPGTVKLLEELANLAHKRGKLEEAESYYTQLLTLQTNETVFGELASAELSLASIKQEKGRLLDAEELYRHAWEKQRTSAGTNWLRSAMTLRPLASVLELENKLSDAE